MTSFAVMLEPFIRQRTIRLITFRRDGTPVNYSGCRGVLLTKRRLKGAAAWAQVYGVGC